MMSLTFDRMMIVSPYGYRNAIGLKLRHRIQSSASRAGEALRARAHLARLKMEIDIGFRH